MRYFVREMMYWLDTTEHTFYPVMLFQWMLVVLTVIVLVLAVYTVFTDEGSKWRKTWWRK
jgi:hypothetical protein